MDVQIINREPQLVAYIRVIGPYNETMPDGFNRLMAWAEPRNLLAGDWLALYWDNPEITPPSDLASCSFTPGRCAASIFLTVTRKSAVLPATSAPW